jgi:hypothetical protein
VSAATLIVHRATDRGPGDHLRHLPVKTKGELPVIPVDVCAAEVRAVKVG